MISGFYQSIKQKRKRRIKPIEPVEDVKMKEEKEEEIKYKFKERMDKRRAKKRRK